jgi:hypothetical protein
MFKGIVEIDVVHAHGSFEFNFLGQNNANNPTTRALLTFTFCIFFMCNRLVFE